MTFINVAPSVYFDAARICGESAAAFFAAVTEQFGDLAGHTKDMAGSIGDGKTWAISYDQQTTETYFLVKSLIGAIDNYAGIIIEAGYNYAIADYDGIGPGPERPIVPNSSLLSCPASPPSAGGTGDGLLDDGLDLATRIGVPIPDGDADKLAKAATCWNTLATEQATTNLPAELERAAALFQEVTSPDVSFIDEDLRALKSAAVDLLSVFADLSTSCRDQEAAHRRVRAELASVLEQFAEDIGKEILVNVALTVAASVVTFGMGSVAVTAIRGGKFATKVKDWVDRLRKVINDLPLRKNVSLKNPPNAENQELERIIDLTKKHGDEAKKTKMTPEEIRQRAQQIGEEVKGLPKGSGKPDILASKLSEMNLSHDDAVQAAVEASKSAFTGVGGTAAAKGGGTVILPELATQQVVLIVKPDGSVIVERGPIWDFMAQ
ncbi:hypothetical protein ACFWPH_05750 [Nocardia sp. NPDC058499]|uniref:hypothetical protein n=1 Tax=Nocardia sp. NPDC058499 TaxID=3346530 RepID=UPI00364ABEBF